jgi:hypothetical protein
VIAGDNDEMCAGEKAAPGKATLRNDSKKRLALLVE